MNTIVPLDEEYFFETDVIISQTDIKGVITYSNRAFSEVSGYTAKELLGQHHSIIRHPSMPSAVFAKMWETILGGQAWNGLIKNLRKDGEFYWVDTEILPIKDESDQVTGFIAARKVASRKDIIENEENYKKILELEE